MLFLLIDLSLREKSLNELVDVFIRFVVVYCSVYEVKADVAGTLMSQFERVAIFLVHASEHQQSLVRFSNVLIVLLLESRVNINALSSLNL